MPELPEVEQFRHALLPLISKNYRTSSPCLDHAESEPNDDDKNVVEAKTFMFRITNYQNHPRIDLSDDTIHDISNHYYCTNVIRKGKQICIILSLQHANSSSSATTAPTLPRTKLL
jgi:hypothetical protein